MLPVNQNNLYREYIPIHLYKTEELPAFQSFLQKRKAGCSRSYLQKQYRTHCFRRSFFAFTEHGADTFLWSPVLL